MRFLNCEHVSERAIQSTAFSDTLGAPLVIGVVPEDYLETDEYKQKRQAQDVGSRRENRK